MSKAREWAVRCALEDARQEHSAFVTLTYNDEHVPVTLSKAHLSGWLKRLRARVRAADEARRREAGKCREEWPYACVRFFGCGEYGEQRGRPHYHALVWGVSDPSLFSKAWRDSKGREIGIVSVDRVEPASIAYVCGYVTKKVSMQQEKEERMDSATGELYWYQPPFILMSRGGRRGVGIAGDARKYWRSWKDFAVKDGKPVPVPRYLHEAWKANVSDQEIEAHQAERREKAKEISEYSLKSASAHLGTILNNKNSRKKL